LFNIKYLIIFKSLYYEILYNKESGRDKNIDIIVLINI